MFKRAHITVKRIVIFLILIVSLILFDFAGFFEFFNNYFYDLSFRIRGLIPPEKNILLIKIDDKSLKRLGRWPIKRSYYTHLIEKVKSAHTIMLDFIMTEPTLEDKALGDAIKSHGRVMLPLLIEDNININYPAVPHEMKNTGHVQIEQDGDGVVRSVYHTLIAGSKKVPSITSIIYENYTGKTFKRENINRVYKKKTKGIIQCDRMKINYVGGYDSFDNISFIDVLDNIYPPNLFKDKIVIVGLTATGTTDIIRTPFLKHRKGMPGIEVHANILHTLILNNAIHDLPAWLRRLLALIFSLSVFFLFMIISEKWSAISGIFFIISILILSYISLTVFNIWVAPTLYCFCIFFAFLTSYISKFEDAVAMLGNAYKTLESRLRWPPEDKQNAYHGLSGLFTKKGINTQVKVLKDVGTQLSFEKELSDRALMSDIHGVLLFGKGRERILINEYASGLFNEHKIDTSIADTFIKSIAPFLLERPDIESIIKNLYNEQGNPTYTLAIGKRYFKIDFSCFSVEDSKYLLIIINDITKIKELELLKSHLISVVSRELKNPMTSILGFSEILSKNLTGKMQNFAAIINRETERLVRFLNTFLDITRIEEGRQPVKLTQVNLKEVIEDVANASKPIADINKINIQTDVPEDIDNIIIDKDLTKQCIFNLVENAIKYSPQGRDIIIRLQDLDETIRIDVIDHGYGIKEEDLEKIFDKFFRSSSEKTKNIKGSGLGLTFVKEAIELQGGQLAVSSKYNEGSTFSIVFPKQKMG